jgi:hypothetical protein
MNILVIPDVHGREFWKHAIDHVDEYDKIIFLGDYLDPYDFEHITVEDAIANFEHIIDFKLANDDKVELLLGNHDLPYYSEYYYKQSWYHCRHSKRYHRDISGIFDGHRDVFKIACTYGDVLFTHAGCTPGWLDEVFTSQYKIESLDDLVFSLNNLLNTEEGLRCLYMVSGDRGGTDAHASCVWADVTDTMWYQRMMENPDCPVREIMKVKQIYGHTLQAFYRLEGGIGYGDAIELGNNKMLDNCKAYVLDTDAFTIKPV